DFTALSDDCGATGTATVTFTATDDCGNASSTTATFTIEDISGPTFTVPADITIECDVDPTNLNITGDVTDETDNCSSGLQASYSDNATPGACANESIITRTWTLMDECGNTSTLEQIINVVDNTIPTFTVPADITIECNLDPTDLSITGDVTDEADNCSTGLQATFQDIIVEGSCPNEYTIQRKWLLMDECENMNSYLQIITVQDTTAPIFNESLPPDISVECDAIPEAEILTAFDNCEDIVVDFGEEITAGACISDQIITRTWTAADSCGNSVSHIQIISVSDTTAPELVTPIDDNITAACDDIPEVPNLVFEDACSNAIDVEFNEESTQVNDFEDYSIIRTWTVTDDCGNSDIFTQNITVEISNVIEATDANRCVLDIEFDLFDLLSGDFDMDGTWTVVSGDASLDGSFFDPSTVEVGVYTFKYAITEGPCPTEVEVDVTIDDDCLVLACGKDNVVISKTVTANGDNINDFFEVKGIEVCGFVIELQIFNRWGAKIYESNNYQNNWNGIANGSSVGGSGQVPTGTYYYVINLRNSGLEPFAGPIYVATN
ncbi:gliding motility-associated C-terminal domain-containing protein, partial [Winogradskyella sp. DF17]